jgi:anti-sigma B factor antagonist
MIAEFASHGDVLVARFQIGRLDASIAGEAKRELIERAQAADACLLLNCKNVDFVDSSGLGVLISVLKLVGARPQAFSFSVSDLKPPVMQLLKLTRLDRVITIWPTEADGVSEINAERSRP